MYILFLTPILKVKIKVFTESDCIKKSTEMVRSDFHQMSTLVRNGTIQKKGSYTLMAKLHSDVGKHYTIILRTKELIGCSKITSRISNGFQTKRSDIDRRKELILF